jgi:hypothetical protein
MKKFCQLMTMLITALFIHSFVSAQDNAAAITFSFVKQDGKVITRNAQDQKVLTFSVTGLNTNEEVDAFVAKLEKMKMVVDVVISYELKDNQRTGVVTFESDAKMLYIKNALLYSGVTQVTVDGNTIKTEDIQLKETERKTENNSTK